MVAAGQARALTFSSAVNSYTPRRQNEILSKSYPKRSCEQKEERCTRLCVADRAHRQPASDFTFPLEDFCQLAHLARQRDQDVSRCVELVPVARPRERCL